MKRLGAGGDRTAHLRGLEDNGLTPVGEHLERSHSSVLKVTSAIADLSVSGRAPRSSFQRAIGGACQRRATAGSDR